MAKGRPVRRKPERPYRRGQWFADLVTLGRKNTNRRAWTEDQNLAGLFDGLIQADLADRKAHFSNGTPGDEVTVPRWVVAGLITYLRLTCRQFRNGRGRTSRWVERYRQDMVDFARYDAVHSLHFNRGFTWSDSYSEAASGLNGLAGGSARTIEGSYKRVAKMLRKGRYGRYFITPYFRIRNLDD